MQTIASVEILPLGPLRLLLSGVAWIVCGICIGIREFLGYRRRVATIATCLSLWRANEKEVRQMLSRRTVAGEKRRVVLVTKTRRVRIDQTVQISYDPKNPGQVYLADEHPRNEHWKWGGTITSIGLVPILYSTLRWGLWHLVDARRSAHLNPVRLPIR
ncbi:hypothetical protein ACFU99_23400 [Streptomyces sp. NPDC057654]|uniref:hypothetical protein n=1 Tax=Streptomyces sp. NPDC057654 TaxID=3346196 RepID=UPI00367463CB